MFCQQCGKEANEGPFCSSCGAKLAPAPKDEHSEVERRPRRIKSLFLGLVGIAVLAWLAWIVHGISSALNNETESTDTAVLGAPTNYGTSPGAVPQPRAIPVPDQESKFVVMIEDFDSRYRQAANEFQKSAVRKERASAIQMIVPDRAAEKWAGQISRMETTGDGHGILGVKLPGGASIQVETTNNPLSDIFDHTLIDPKSALYGEIANLAVGDKVIFDGNFRSGDMDYLEEMSLTEEGFMTAPEFIFAFSSVSALP